MKKRIFESLENAAMQLLVAPLLRGMLFTLQNAQFSGTVRQTERGYEFEVVPNIPTPKPPSTPIQDILESRNGKKVA